VRAAQVSKSRVNAPQGAQWDKPATATRQLIAHRTDRKLLTTK